MNRKIIQAALALLVVSLLLTAPRAQQPAPQSTDDRVVLYQALLDLTNPWTVMCIAAHPDDEDGTSLIVMRRKYGAHTVSLFSTFGEGGQNAIGPELYEEMGAIRARETIAAAEIQGSEPHFLGLKDFGYSKSADEAFKFWGHDEALRRMVLEIRKLQPDVIITNHSVTSNDHGHHQATARLEVEAFDAAADPARFPEQLKDGVTTWQVQRLFVRARGNQNQTDTARVVTVDPNEQDPVRGTSFAEQALSALQKHATQGPWPKSVAQMAARFTNSRDGRLPMTRYRLAREAKGAAPMPAQDSHNFLDGLRLPEKTAKQIELPGVEGHTLVELAGDRSKVLATLVKGLRAGFYGESEDKSDERRLLWMRQRLERALSLAAGVTLEAEPSRRVAAPGATFDLAVRLSNSGSENVTVSACSASPGPVGGFLAGDKLAAGTNLRRVVKVTIPNSAPKNVPLSSHLYDSSASGLQLRTHCLIDLPYGYFNAIASTQIDIAPAVEISRFSPSSLVITPQTENVSRTLTLQVINHEKDVQKISIETIAAGDNPEPRRRKIAEGFLTIGPAEKRELSIRLPIESKTETEMVKIQRRSVLTPGQPSATVPEPAPVAPNPRLLLRATNGASNEVAIPMVYSAARVVPNLKVGYVRGFDYSLPNALTALGVESKELSVDEVRTADLSKFTSFIVDNRVYESQPKLIEANQKLLDYANAGGNLIVFYHKSDEWNPSEQKNRPQLAPYKLILGNERVTDENAPITFIEADHPLLNVPNKLNQDDFKDWIQERGLYYPKEWDPQYHALLQSNDSGEAPLKGGLLVADYGRGHYIYTSMVWYRELRAGVPGAYRMLANMISYGGAEGKSKEGNP